MSLIFSIVVPAKVAPNVPPSTIRSAGMFRNAAGEAPSMRAPTASPANATPIPMAVEAFIEGYRVDRLRPPHLKGDPRRLDECRIGARARALAPGRICDGHAPFAHALDDLVGGLADDDLRAGRERHDRVRMGLDRDD